MAQVELIHQQDLITSIKKNVWESARRIGNLSSQLQICQRDGNTFMLTAGSLPLNGSNMLVIM